MVKRKRIALIYSMNKEWIGGTYYILNLIAALNTLDDNDKPIIILVCSSYADFVYVRQYTCYGYLDYFLYKSYTNFFPRLLNKISLRLLQKRICCKVGLSLPASLLFPLNDLFLASKRYISLAWIPDFQEKYYPEFFSKQELFHRDKNIRDIIKAGLPIVFSSVNAQNDFRKFYPEGEKISTFVMHFAVSLPQIKLTAEQILAKYDATIPYFFCANQFWIHKNHRLLFEAVKLLKDAGEEVVVYCSGNTTDYRNPNYFAELQVYIRDNHLEENIRILGFIDREEQLCLMKCAKAIIQPSLFEGWSTVVEDAKALHKWVLLSDIPLHREQMVNNVTFFNPKDVRDLAFKMKEILVNNLHMQDYDYRENVISFGLSFMRIVDAILSGN